MNRNSLKAAAWILAAISLAGQARAAEENPVLLRFDTSVLSYAAHDGQVPTTNNFTPWGGKPLSADTVAEEITPTALPLVGGACKWLRTGGTNQAVAFEAAKAWPGARGAFSFWATGKNWDLHSPVRETLLVIEGDDDAVAVERSKPGMLSVASSKGPRLDVPFVGNPNAPHFVTVNFEPGQTTLFIERRASRRRWEHRLANDAEAAGLRSTGPRTGTQQTSRKFDHLQAAPHARRDGHVVL